MFTPAIHRWLFIFSLCALAFGMMVGTVPTSVPQFMLLGNWLLEGDLRRKWHQLKGNRVFWILSSVFLAHVVGLLWTDDLFSGWNDVRTKIPLMFLPLVLFSSRPLEKNYFHLVLYAFILGCFINTLWCIIYSFVLHSNEQMRDVSRFMSHIRLGLYLNMAICCCFYFFRLTEELPRRAVLAVAMIYFTAMLLVLGLATGLINLIILCLLALLWYAWKSRGKLKVIALCVSAVVVLSTVLFIKHVRDEQIGVKYSDVNIPAIKNPAGNLYIHFDKRGQKENGYYVLMNIQLQELQRAWKRDFPADSFSYEPAHNLSRYEVLVRYMASKGLMKDSVGYAALTAEDKIHVRNNVTNYLYPDWSPLRKRTYEFVNEFDEFRNNRYVNGHSLTMRLYFWKAASYAIAEKPLTGWGTGDVHAAMTAAYAATGSPLSPEWHKRPHNQFITVAVALGIMGFVIFLVTLVYPVKLLRRSLTWLYKPFLITAILSFLLEDTLETQAGLTFFAFFNTLLLSRAWFKTQQIPGDSPASR
jgi:hypothetical protein